MSIHDIGLRKLLGLFYMTPPQLTSALRSDIRNEISKLNGFQTGGGDFHVPFWKDAKAHVASESDLSITTKHRIESNVRRERLYPLLRDGFLQWWNDKRRWSNQEFEILSTSVMGRYEIPELAASVRVDNFLALKIADNTNKLIYPYFSEATPLQPEAARIGLWLLGAALLKYDVSDMRILDVLRSQSFSVSDVPLQGNEEGIFTSKYRHILERRAVLKIEYE